MPTGEASTPDHSLLLSVYGGGRLHGLLGTWRRLRHGIQRFCATISGTGRGFCKCRGSQTDFTRSRTGRCWLQGTLTTRGIRHLRQPWRPWTLPAIRTLNLNDAEHALSRIRRWWLEGEPRRTSGDVAALALAARASAELATAGHKFAIGRCAKR